MSLFFFFNDTATTEIYTLSLHDALPICFTRSSPSPCSTAIRCGTVCESSPSGPFTITRPGESETLTPARSEEHTSELQSRQYLVCRLLLEKKNTRYAPWRRPDLALVVQH